MPSTSEKQRRLACVALSIRRGKAPKWVSEAARDMAKSMSESQLEDYCRSVKK